MSVHGEAWEKILIKMTVYRHYDEYFPVFFYEAGTGTVHPYCTVMEKPETEQF